MELKDILLDLMKLHGVRGILEEMSDAIALYGDAVAPEYKPSLYYELVVNIRQAVEKAARKASGKCDNPHAPF